MATHDLKTIQPYFDDLASGRKTFEVRRNDRAFQAGDTVILREYNPRGNCSSRHDEPSGLLAISDRCQYTGRTLRFVITYVLTACPVAPLGDLAVLALGPAQD